MKRRNGLLKIVCCALLLLGGADIFAQKNPCAGLMQQGDACAAAKNFQCAIDKYTAALIVCPDLQDEARDRIQGVFLQIEKLRKDAAANEEKAKRALAQAEKSEKLAREASEKQQQLINAFYFYEDSLALAFDGHQFGYVNKAGGIEINYQYFKADAFTDPGIARADYGEGNGLIDTRGQFYALNEYDNSDSLVEDAQAIIIEGMSRKVLFQRCARLDQIQILVLTGTYHPDFPDYVPPDARTEKEPYDWDTIFGLENLVILDLSGNQMDSISPALGNLKHLKRLSLATNYIQRLPREIGKLDSLEWLNLSFSGLSYTDSSLEKNLASTPKYPLPREIGLLKGLKYLNLDANTLSTLPSEIGGLSNLRIFNVQSSWLWSLPPEIGLLDSLTKLNVGENRLTSLPSQIGGLKNLTELQCNRNQLKTLPREIGELKNLRELSMEENNIDFLPDEFGNLSSLEVLLFSENPIQKLPETFGNLKSLQILYLNDNKLTSLPESFCNLASLAVLILDRTPLTSLPKDLAKLKNLRVLSLRGCSFSDPDEMERIREQLPNCEVITAEYED